MIFLLLSILNYNYMRSEEYNTSNHFQNNINNINQSYYISFVYIDLTRIA